MIYYSVVLCSTLAPQVRSLNIKNEINCVNEG